MYRAVALAAREAGIRPDERNVEERLRPVLAGLKLKFDGEKILLNGRDIIAVISEPEIGDLSTRLSALRTVIERMSELQRAAGSGGGAAVERGDINTALVPHA